MTINRYDVGDKVRVSFSFTDGDGVAVDPDTVKFQYRVGSSGRTTETYNGSPPGLVVRDSAGNYHFDIDCTAAGRYRYRAFSEGSGQSAARGEFVVEPSGME